MEKKENYRVNKFRVSYLIIFLENKIKIIVKYFKKRY